MYLSVSPGVASSRAAYGVERYETVDIQNRVKAQFQLVAEQVRKRHGTYRWIDVSAEGSIEEVGRTIWSALEDSRPGTTASLGVLWRDASC
jgi:dTMP kinase